MRSGLGEAQSFIDLQLKVNTASSRQVDIKVAQKGFRVPHTCAIHPLYGMILGALKGAEADTMLGWSSAPPVRLQLKGEASSDS